jgi:hypothetical protein
MKTSDFILQERKLKLIINAETENIFYPIFFNYTGVLTHLNMLSFSLQNYSSGHFGYKIQVS